MRVYSTNNPYKFYSLEEAVILGQAPDGGLFMPEFIPQLAKEEIDNIKNYSFNEIALLISKQFFGDDIPLQDLNEIINSAYSFNAPLNKIDSNLYFLELFHGPTLAFKDFGARFMAQLMSYYLRKSGQKLNILVATSGDTGGAVASAFYQVPNINVIILFPSKKVSKMQELQLTTWGGNIHALEIEGTFDDCQKFVKTAFLDQEFKESCQLTSANSINISRLIPQSFYYFYAWSKLDHAQKSSFIVPSGNLGNVSAGIIAKKMGLPIDHFVIGTNANRVVPDYFTTGNFNPQSSISTISNAMDVGNPSNLKRLQVLSNNNLLELKEISSSIFFSDQETAEAIKEVYQKYNYLICPHTAIGYLAAKELKNDHQKVILATAHPNKFSDVLEKILKMELPEVESLQSLWNKKTTEIKLPNNYQQIKNTIKQIL